MGGACKIKARCEKSGRLKVRVAFRRPDTFVKSEPSRDHFRRPKNHSGSRQSDRRYTHKLPFKRQIQKRKSIYRIRRLESPSKRIRQKRKRQGQTNPIRKQAAALRSLHARNGSLKTRLFLRARKPSKSQKQTADGDTCCHHAQIGRYRISPLQKRRKVRFRTLQSRVKLTQNNKAGFAGKSSKTRLISSYLRKMTHLSIK